MTLFLFSIALFFINVLPLLDILKHGQRDTYLYFPSPQLCGFLATALFCARVICHCYNYHNFELIRIIRVPFHSIHLAFRSLQSPPILPFPLSYPLNLFTLCSSFFASLLRVIWHVVIWMCRGVWETRVSISLSVLSLCISLHHFFCLSVCFSSLSLFYITLCFYFIATFYKWV